MIETPSGILTEDYSDIAVLVEPLITRTLGAYLAGDLPTTYDAITEITRHGAGTVFYAVKRLGATAARGLSKLQRGEVLAHAHIAEDTGVQRWYDPFTGKPIDPDEQHAAARLFVARFLTAIVTQDLAEQVRVWTLLVNHSDPAANAATVAINALVTLAARTYARDLKAACLRHAHPAARTRRAGNGRRRTK